MVLQSCVLFWSLVYGIDPQITNAVISVESNGKPFSVSPDRKDFGLMQIRQMYVPFTKLQLLQSCTNVMVGTDLLRKAKEKCKHSLDKSWVVCYNLGLSGARKIRQPKKQTYYKKIIAKLEQ